MTTKSIRDGYFSPNFSIQEMIYSETASARGINNNPSAIAITQLYKLCNDVLEKIRDMCQGNPVNVSSGFRCSALNQAIGGAAGSAHLYGCAADITIPGFGTPLEICRLLEPNLKDLGIDQLIYERPGGVWVHVGIAIPPNTVPRGQSLTISPAGTVGGIVE